MLAVAHFGWIVAGVILLVLLYIVLMMFVGRYLGSLDKKHQKHIEKMWKMERMLAACIQQLCASEKARRQSGGGKTTGRYKVDGLYATHERTGEGTSRLERWELEISTPNRPKEMGRTLWGYWRQFVPTNRIVMMAVGDGPPRDINKGKNYPDE